MMKIDLTLALCAALAGAGAPAPAASPLPPPPGVRALLPGQERVQGERRIGDLVRRGRGHLEAGRLERALELFEQADAETHGAFATRVWVLRTWMSLGRINDAFDQVDALAADHVGPDLDYLYGMGSYLKAKQYIAQAVPPTTTGLALQDAQSFLSTALEADPGRYRDAWLPLAEVAWLNQDLDRAASAIAAALELWGTDPQARFLEGRIHFSRFATLRIREDAQDQARDLLEGSIAAFRRALCLVEPSPDQAPFLARVQRELAIALQWQADRPGAVAAYAEALGWDPGVLSFAQTWGSLGLEGFLATLEAGEQRFVEHWGEETVQDATLLWWLGSALYSAGEFERCEETFQRVLAKWPAHVNSWFYVALSRYQREDYDGAIQAWHENWKVDRGDLVASIQGERELNLAILDFVVGWCHERVPPQGTQGEYNVKAAFLCEVRCAVSPESWEYWDNWGLFARDAGAFIRDRGRAGDAEWAKKRFEEAWTAYQTAIELAPDRPHLQNDAAVVLDYYLERDLELALSMYAKAHAMATAQLERGEFASEQDRTLVETALRDSGANLERLRRKLGR